MLLQEYEKIKIFGIKRYIKSLLKKRYCLHGNKAWMLGKFIKSKRFCFDCLSDFSPTKEWWLWG